MTSLKEREELYKEIYQKMKKRKKTLSIVIIFDKSIPFEQEQYKYILEIEGLFNVKTIYGGKNIKALTITDNKDEIELFKLK